MIRHRLGRGSTHRKLLWRCTVDNGWFAWMTSLRGVLGDGGDFGAQGPKNIKGGLNWYRGANSSGWEVEEGLCCNFISFWVRTCAARTHTVPVLVRCREKGTGAVKGLLSSIRGKQGARSLVVMGRRVCGCGKSGLRSFWSESSTFFASSRWRSHDRPNGPGGLCGAVWSVFLYLTR